MTHNKNKKLEPKKYFICNLNLASKGLALIMVSRWIASSYINYLKKNGLSDFQTFSVLFNNFFVFLLQQFFSLFIVELDAAGNVDPHLPECFIFVRRIKTIFDINSILTHALSIMLNVTILYGSLWSTRGIR